MINKSSASKYMDFFPVQTFESSSGKETYTTKLDIIQTMKEGRIRCSCNCKGWTIKRKDKDFRSCKHTDEVEEKIKIGLVGLPTQAVEIWKKHGLQIEEDIMGLRKIIDEKLNFNKSEETIIAVCVVCDHEQEHSKGIIVTCEDCGEDYVLY